MSMTSGPTGPQVEPEDLDEELMRTVRSFTAVDRAVDRYKAQLAGKVPWSPDFSFAGTAV